MNLVLSNPAGFWALLGIPTVILIHFLQRQARVVPISTLFLLAQTQRESVSGRRFDRLTNSVPLWLQLLMVLLLTWLLVEPRYVKPASTQQVAVVVDSSASMTVFKEQLSKKLREKLPPLQGEAARLQIYIFESAPDRPTIYAGEDLEEALLAIDEWTPSAGATDPSTALRLARSRVSREGVLVFVSDTPAEELPFNAQNLAVGAPTPNVGFTGVSFKKQPEGTRWTALIRNYSDSPQSRSWHVEFEDGSKSQPSSIDLAENAMSTVSATFPGDSKRLRVVLTEDKFPLDDELPLVVPAPKLLSIFSETSAKFESFTDKLRDSFEAIAPTNDSASADLSLVSYDPLLPTLPESSSIVFVDETTQSKKYLRGGIVAEKNVLMEGLNWQSLLVRESIQIQLRETDVVLLWQGDRPLIALRSFRREIGGTDGTRTREIRQLIFNFDPTLSNAFKLPATVVLLHRFTEQLRSRKVAEESRNTEAGQPLQLSVHQHADAPPLALSLTKAEETDAPDPIPPAEATSLRAPDEPGFYTISQGDDVLLRSACHFADTREADLRSCDAQDTIVATSGEAIERNTSEDHFWRLWVLLTLVALLLAWQFTKDRPREEKGDEEASALPRPSTTKAT